MKLLLDENLPKRLKQDLKEHEVFTARDKGWHGKKNGELLAKLIEQKFDVLLTFDKNLQFQQNFSKYPIAVFILIETDNTYLSLKQLIPEIKSALKRKIKTGIIVIKK